MYSIILILFVLSFLDQILFNIIFLTVSNKHFKKFNYQTVQNPVSVIIAAKNEAENLKKFLPKILSQNYSNFEVIVVNDGSTDNTREVLENFQHTHTNLLKVINIEKSNSKKNALTVGISSSSYEHLLFTDADCEPASENWIATMCSKFSNSKKIILGYGAYQKEKTLLNAFINYDTYSISIQYFTAAKLGFPYMGVGRNLAYTKTLWQQTNGFEKDMDILSGDDDLFIANAANSNNVEISANNESFTYSVPKKSFLDFIKQKSRHLTTSKRYSFINSFLSSAELISRSIFYCFAVLSLFFQKLLIFSIILVIIRLILIYIINIPIRKKLNNKIPFHYFILFDIFATLFYLIVFFYKTFIFNKKQW